MRAEQRQVQERLQTAIEHATPDVFERILEGCRAPALSVLPPPEKKPVKKAFPLRGIMSAAAMLVIIAGLFLGYRLLGNRVDSVVIMDVNPSVELQLNRSERVVRAQAQNEDGERLLDGMDLTGADMDVAVNALIGSMLRQGYLDEYKNSILLTVSSAGGAPNTELETRLVGRVERLLKESSLEGAIISQQASESGELDGLAEQYHVSSGKALLIQKMIEKIPMYTFEELSALSINDLNLLLSSRHMTLEQVEASGNASEKGYIGHEKAKELAMQAAGVTTAEQTEIEMDSENGVMCYEVEFVSAGKKYEFELRASDGSILSRSSETEDEASPRHPDWITEAEAGKLALEHAGVTDKTVEIYVEYDENSAEVEFTSNGRSYEYRLDAVTGRILEWESEPGDSF